MLGGAGGKKKPITSSTRGMTLAVPKKSSETKSRGERERTTKNRHEGSQGYEP